VFQSRLQVSISGWSIFAVAIRSGYPTLAASQVFAARVGYLDPFITETIKNALPAVEDITDK
jgi:hypothetical protein